MPVGGRINRRDNLRSKKDLIKSKSDKDNNSKPIPENIPGLRNLEILKQKNADAKIKSKQVTNKSEIFIDSLRSSYICLEDISLIENNINIDNVKQDDISDLKDNAEVNIDPLIQTKSKINISKKKMKIDRSNKDENGTLIIQDVISNSEKKSKIETMKDNSGNDTKNISKETSISPKKDCEFKDIKPETIKRKGRSKAPKTDEPLTNQIPNDFINMETTSKLKSIEKSDVRGKSRSHQKKDESEMTTAVTEKSMPASPTKTNKKKVKATNQVDESSIKNRLHQKKEESELSNLITEKSISQTPIKLNEKKSKEIKQIEESLIVESETKQPDQDTEQMKSKRGRRPVIQKNVEKTELVEVQQEKIEVVETAETHSPRKSRVRSSRKQTDYNDINEVDPPESVIAVIAKNTIDLDTNEDKMEVDEPALIEKPVDNVPTMTTDIAVSSKRKAARKGKTRVPFVVEKMDSDKQETDTPAMKNPGLLMLENIRNRKSGVIKPTGAIEILPKSDTKKLEVKQLPQDIRELALPKPKQEIAAEKKEQSDNATNRNERKNVQEKKRYSVVKPMDKNQTSVDVVISEPPACVESSPMEIDQVPVKVDNTPIQMKTRKSEAHLEIDQIPLKVDNTPIQKKTRKSEAHLATKPPKQPEPAAEIKIPGLRMIEDIRRRKSELVTSSSRTISVAGDGPAIASTSAKSTTTVRQLVLSVGDVAIPPPIPVAISNESKIPGLSTIEELRSYSRQSIHSPAKDKISGLAKRSRQPLASNGSANVPVAMATEKVKVPVALGAEKVPGLSVMRDVHKQKMINKTPVTPVAFQSPIVSRSTIREIDNNVVTSTSKSILPPHLLQSARGTPISILCKSSPYKRPISCLVDDSDDLNAADVIPGESVRKMARVQVEKRQSVTFNREVAVKEIHGNSFNSVSDDSDQPELPHRTLNASLATVPTDELARAEFERKLESELERTKNYLKDRRRFNSSSGTGTMSRQKEMAAAHQLAMISKPMRPLTKKRSDLSNLISERAKLTSLSPPRVPLASAARGNGAGIVASGGASKKVTNVSRRPEVGSHPVDQWKSFRNPVSIPDDVDDDQHDDDSMSCEESPAPAGNKDQGRSCVLM